MKGTTMLGAIGSVGLGALSIPMMLFGDPSGSVSRFLQVVFYAGLALLAIAIVCLISVVRGGPVRRSTVLGVIGAVGFGALGPFLILVGISRFGGPCTVEPCPDPYVLQDVSLVLGVALMIVALACLVLVFTRAVRRIAAAVLRPG
jgi:hypothetical protein